MFPPVHGCTIPGNRGPAQAIDGSGGDGIVRAFVRRAKVTRTSTEAANARHVLAVPAYGDPTLASGFLRLIRVEAVCATTAVDRHPAAAGDL